MEVLSDISLTSRLSKDAFEIAPKDLENEIVEEVALKHGEFVIC